MAGQTHQTVRLASGKHSSPESGVCVMELASMLAGEPFSDRPESVCPVIAGFLRTYNDALEDDRRQDLYRIAAEVVGTRSTHAIERARGDVALCWAAEHREALRRGLRRLLPAPAFAVITSVDAGVSAARVAGKLVAKGHPGAHEAALALVGQLIGQRAASTPGADHAFGGSSRGDVVMERTTRSGASRTPMASA